MAKILPILFLLFGIGGGIGAGVLVEAGPGTIGSGQRNGSDNPSAVIKEDDHPATEFIKMSNQFVVPVVQGDSITALVVVSLSIEVRAGNSERVYAREPRLRDAFLRVMFDHANMGGFQGAFTRAENMGLLRSALREVAEQEIGSDLVDILIVDIVRQDT